MYQRARVSAAVCVAIATLPLMAILLSPGSARADSGWSAQTSPVTTGLSAVDFVDADQGWICGKNGAILHTVDGGEHWTIQPSGTTLDLWDISFADSQVGYAVGTMKIVLRTTNGGSSWETIMSPQQDLPFSSVQTLDPQRLWTTGSSIGGPSFLGFVNWSSNGGTTWEGYRPPCSDPPHYCSTSILDVSVVNSQVAFASGYAQRYDGSTYGTIYRTTDGGATFEQLPAGAAMSCPAIQFLNPSVGYVVGWELAKTTDGGATWSSLPTGMGIRNLLFVDVNTGWTIGGQGEIARTGDGGNTWVQQASGSTQSLNDVDFVNAWTGTVVGDNGTILHTVSGGEAGAGSPDLVRSGDLRLLAPTPNPFSHEVRITYELPGLSEISLDVYDAAGRLLRNLEGGPSAAGRHTVSWDGTDASGAAVARGVYFVRLSGAGETRRVMVVR